MKINYKIIGFDKDLGQITISPDGYPSFALDLPISDDGLVITGEQLDQYINGFLPYTLEIRKQTIANVGIKNFDEIIKLAEIPEIATVEPVVTVETDDQKWANLRSERFTRLAMTDWVEIPTVRAQKSEQWAKEWDLYRQSLRDLPANVIDINNVIWPIPPAN